LKESLSYLNKSGIKNKMKKNILFYMGGILLVSAFFLEMVIEPFDCINMEGQQQISCLNRVHVWEVITFISFILGFILFVVGWVRKNE
jgi:hypothetical protein